MMWKTVLSSSQAVTHT